MVYRTVFKSSGDRHFVRFEPEGQVAARELMAHNLVTGTPFLHCGAGRDISGHCDFQRRLTVGWINREYQVYRPMSVIFLDEVRFLGLSHFSPPFAGLGPVARYRLSIRPRSPPCMFRGSD